MRDLSSCNQYEIKRQFFKFVGANFRIFDNTGALVYMSHQKGFKLKEEIQVFYDEEQTQLAFSIHARQIIDFSAAYDVIDAATGQKIGALRRQGFKSMIRDEWHVLDANDRQIATVIEDSQLLALVRRFLSALVPQNYDFLMNDGLRIVDLRQHWNPLLYWMTIEFTDHGAGVDRRIGIATAILLAAIEGRER